MSRLSRRSFLGAAIASGAAPWLASAQPSRPRVVGYLSGGQGPEFLYKILALRGYVEGRNVRIETRIPPDWEPASLAKAAQELVAARPDALYAMMGNRVGALAAATRTIPIVTGGIPDPIGAGFAKSLRQPGGNVTGLSWGFPETADIVVGLLKTVRPGLMRLGGLFASGLPPVHMGPWWKEACNKAGIEWTAAAVATVQEAERMLAGLAGQAAIVAPMKDQALGSMIVPAATRLRVMTLGRMEEGALFSYGLGFENTEERIAALLDQVLRGGNPATIPFELPDRPSFEWNRTTAKAIGVELPRDMVLRVTRVVD